MLRGGRFGGKLCEAFLPNNSWGPSSIKERTDWQVEKMMTITMMTMMSKTMMTTVVTKTMMMTMTTTMMIAFFKVYSETHSKLEFLPSKLRSRLEKDSTADEQLPK